MMFSKPYACLILLAFTTLLPAQTTLPTTAPTVPAVPAPAPRTHPNARAQRALIISIDGLRPDVLLRADARASAS
jgi:predicted AlkP superfamily pyrophosphatase or phosphodiesterase